MAQATYANIYELLGFNASNGSWASESDPYYGTTINEDYTTPDADETLSADDGEVSDQQDVYTGWSYQGDPITSMGGGYWLFTNGTPDFITGGRQATSTPELTLCFLPDTQIATPTGPVAIETLTIGAVVCTVTPSGEPSVAPVKFLFKQSVRLHPFIDHRTVLPICIRAGALGQHQPKRDLYVSPDHALLVDGCLVHAAALINGRTITQLKDWNGGEWVYYHIETEAHALILAEGAPAETFIDNVSREKFDNYAEYQVLYPDAAPMVESDLPRVKYACQLPRAISRRLEAVADSLNGEAARAA